MADVAMFSMEIILYKNNQCKKRQILRMYVSPTKLQDNQSRTNYLNYNFLFPANRFPLFIGREVCECRAFMGVGTRIQGFY